MKYSYSAHRKRVSFSGIQKASAVTAPSLRSNASAISNFVIYCPPPSASQPTVFPTPVLIFTSKKIHRSALNLMQHSWPQNFCCSTENMKYINYNIMCLVAVLAPTDNLWRDLTSDAFRALYVEKARFLDAYLLVLAISYLFLLALYFSLGIFRNAKTLSEFKKAGVLI